MKRDNLISVIIPTYKRVKDLKRAVDSVISQTFSNWEIIVIDNHSEDGTKELIRKYNNLKIKLFFIRNKGNIAKSRNLGIEFSKGDYIAFSKELMKLNSVSQALSANILGAMLGGFLEYNSMYFGLSSLYVLSGFLYILAFIFSVQKFRIN